MAREALLSEGLPMQRLCSLCACTLGSLLAAGTQPGWKPPAAAEPLPLASRVGAGGPGGLLNAGYWGIHLEAGRPYWLSLFMLNPKV